VIEIAARGGLVAFLTAGLAVALKLYAGLEPGDPNMLRVCAGFFIWCSLLVMATCPERAKGNDGRDRRHPGDREGRPS
jgi:hypothetical protein